MLRSMNCIYGQGFYFCKPMTVQEIHSMLDRMDADDYACTDLRRRNAEEGVFLRDLKTERDFEGERACACRHGFEYRRIAGR